MTLHLFSQKRQFTTDPKHISSVIRIGMLPSRSGEGINSWMKTERNKNATFIVQFMCEFQWICPLLRQFKPTRKNDQVDGWTTGMKTDSRHREENFVARITDTFFIRVHTECARNWRTGSGQRFVQPIFSTRAIRRHFTVDVVVINWSRLMTCVASNEQRATCACQKNDGRIVDVWCGTVRSSCVCAPYVRCSFRLSINPWNLFYTTIVYFIGQHSLYIFMLCSVNQQLWPLCEHNFIHNVEDGVGCRTLQFSWTHGRWHEYFNGALPSIFSSFLVSLHLSRPFMVLSKRCENRRDFVRFLLTKCTMNERCNGMVKPHTWNDAWTVWLDRLHVTVSVCVETRWTRRCGAQKKKSDGERFTQCVWNYCQRIYVKLANTVLHVQHRVRAERMENSEGDLNARYGVRWTPVERRRRMKKVDELVRTHSAQSSHFMRRLATLHSSINWSITLRCVQCLWIFICLHLRCDWLYLSSVARLLWISAEDKFHIVSLPSALHRIFSLCIVNRTRRSSILWQWRSFACVSE